ALPCKLDCLRSVGRASHHIDALVGGQEHLERLGEERLVVGDEDPHGGITYVPMDEGARTKIQKLLVTGDNRLKQGVDPAKVRASYEQAREVPGALGVGAAAREPDARPSFQLRPQRALADERQAAATEAREGVGEPNDVLALGQAADADEAWPVVPVRAW